MDDMIVELFGSFPREVRLWRKKVRNIRELEFELSRGAKHISAYTSNPVIDKAIFDIDGDTIKDSLDCTRILINRIKNKKLSFIPLFSGRRGFHIYALFKAFKPPNAETGKAILKSVQENLAGDLDEVDSQSFGYIRQMIRIPNTMHELTGCYCTFLPTDFIDWSPLDIVTWAKSRRHIQYDIGERADIRDFAIDIDIKHKRSLEIDHKIEGQHPIPPDIRTFLSKLIKPCLLEEVVKNNPCHAIRTELASELMALGYDEKHVIQIIRELNWGNYDYAKTKYHVSKIFSKRLNPMSCKTLKRYVKCRDNCSWRYLW